MSKTSKSISELIDQLGSEEAQEGAIRQLVNSGSDAVAPLVSALYCEDDGVESRTVNAARVLAVLADDWVYSQLQERLLADDWRERCGAVIAFAEIGGNRALKVLMDLLFSDGFIVLADGRRKEGIGQDEREYAHVALMEMAEKENIVGEVSRMLAHEKRDYRARAIRLLAKIGTEDAIEALQRHLPLERDPGTQHLLSHIVAGKRPMMPGTRNTILI